MTTTARILQSHGLNANKSAILARELGLTDDTEQPVIGSTVAGAKYLGTEEFLQIVTAAPAAIPILRRSHVAISCDLATAGASIALDIRNGAQVAGYRCTVFALGPDTTQAVVHYSTGFLEYIPAGTSQEFIWSGSAWMKTRISWGEKHLMGETIYLPTKPTVCCKCPVVDRSVDVDITPAQYPTYVAYLRDIKANVLGVTDFATTMFAASIVQFPNAADNLLKLLQEDAMVSSFLNLGQPATFSQDYATAATQRSVNVNGVDYVYTNVDLVNRRVTVVGTPLAGTSCVYTYRISGSANARLHKLAGFVGVIAGDIDGEVVGGFRKMDREQGHRHGFAGGSGAYFATTSYFGGSTSAGATGGLIGDFIPNTTDGTPRAGKTTNPRTAGLYAFSWACVFVA